MKQVRDLSGGERRRLGPGRPRHLRSELPRARRADEPPRPRFAGDARGSPRGLRGHGAPRLARPRADRRRRAAHCGDRGRDDQGLRRRVGRSRPRTRRARGAQGRTSPEAGEAESCVEAQARSRPACGDRSRDRACRSARSRGSRRSSRRTGRTPRRSPPMPALGRTSRLSLRAGRPSSRRWQAPRPSSRERRGVPTSLGMTATRILACLAALAALGFYMGPHRTQQADEAELARIATVIAGRDVRISCPGTLATLTEASAQDGSVLFNSEGTPADEAKLSGDTCARLRGFLHGGVGGLELPGPAAAVPARRARGGDRRQRPFPRGVAPCRSPGRGGDPVLRAADPTPTPRCASAPAETTRRRSPRTSSAEVQPVLPADYRSSDCFDGGPLDLHPDRQSWP